MELAAECSGKNKRKQFSRKGTESLHVKNVAAYAMVFGSADPVKREAECVFVNPQ